MKGEDPHAIQIAGGIAIHDVSRLLPQHPTKVPKPKTKPITTLFFHHSGKDSGLDGIDAFIAMANYHTRNKKWATIAYPWGINQRPCIDSNGNLAIFQLLPLNIISNHTKWCNRFSQAVVLQGHHGKVPLSDFQIECIEAFNPWWCEEYDRNYRKDIGWHSISMKWGGIPKLACPGKYAVEYLKDYISK
jgi:hypothetical protein